MTRTRVTIGMRAVGVLVACFLQSNQCMANDVAAADQPTSQNSVSGQEITSGDLKGTQAVRTFTPEEFAAATDKWAADQCKKGTLRATSDGSRIALDGNDFAIEDFGAELLRRYKAKHFYCVDIVGPGFDVKRVNKLLREVKGTDISSINWRPNEVK